MALLRTAVRGPAAATSRLLWSSSVPAPFSTFPASFAPKTPLLDEYGLSVRLLQPLDCSGKLIPPRPTQENNGSIVASTSALPSPLPKLERVVKRVRAKKPSSESASTESIPSDESQTVLERAIRTDLARYPSAILLTQVGSFFESYFDQAPLVARLLGIKLTSKTWGRGNEKTRAPFCGFPTGQLSKHLTTLVEGGWKVVVVEEIAEEGTTVSGSPKGRRVTRIVTPGTGIDDGFVQHDKMNFVLAIGLSDTDSDRPSVSLAYRDISTGAAFSKASSLAQLRDDIFLVEPREVVLDTALATIPLGEQIAALVALEETREPWIVSTVASASLDAEQVLNAYLASTLLSTPPLVNEVQVVDPEKVLQMDSTTLKSLEIRTSLRGGVKGTLMGTVRRTATPGGARLLLERLCAPSTELAEITARHDLVSTFVALPDLRLYLLSLLKTFDDTSRLLQRLSMKRPNSAFDLLGLKKTLQGVSEIRTALLDHISDRASDQAVRNLTEQLRPNEALAREIERAIDEEALVVRTAAAEKRSGLSESLGVSGAEKELSEEEEGWRKTPGLWGYNGEWVIRPESSQALQKLHGELAVLRSKANDLEQSLRKTYKVDSLTLKVVPKQGPILHAATKVTTKLDEDSSRVVLASKTGSTKSYFLAEWFALHAALEKKASNIGKLEEQTVKALVAQVIEGYHSLQAMSAALDKLDVSLGFAQLAQELGWVRPSVDEGTGLKIVAGRHPTVEQALQQNGRVFSANSLELSHPTAFIHCLTGPNMAGKSTFLRQNALIVILAQAGSFVPADSVSLGVVDRVFSRVGARDELDRDRSTFMVEMDEAAGIMHTATDRSLVLFDELGRGTSPLDGLAIAYGALEHLVNVNRSRTLFATHYHRLAHLMGYEGQKSLNSLARGQAEWEGVEFWCTDLKEEAGIVTYSHTIRRGLNDDSAGLVIARLAGLPERLLAVAEEVKRRYGH